MSGTTTVRHSVAQLGAHQGPDSIKIPFQWDSGQELLPRGTGGSHWHESVATRQANKKTTSDQPLPKRTVISEISKWIRLKLPYHSRILTLLWSPGNTQHLFWFWHSHSCEKYTTLAGSMLTDGPGAALWIHHHTSCECSYQRLSMKRLLVQSCSWTWNSSDGQFWCKISPRSGWTFLGIVQKPESLPIQTSFLFCLLYRRQTSIVSWSPCLL